MSTQQVYKSRRDFVVASIKVGCSATCAAMCSYLSDSANGNENMNSETNQRLFCFLGGSKGSWRVESITTIVGDPIPKVSHVDIVQGNVQSGNSEGWIIRGVTSNERYTKREEKDQLVAKQASLGRPQANLSALIPIRKNAKWWALTQDERRAILEERSKHITIGLKYLPEIARRLHHCRDLEGGQPFDFLTLFDYSQENQAKFNDMLAELRETEEWKFVDREVDIRLVRVP